jgi:hypothetical protein
VTRSLSLLCRKDKKEQTGLQSGHASLGGTVARLPA